ncbi:MAG TPA: beta-ketoacyl-[acyl-carrier-protein] synthase II [candidate division WOR-3 bacterium]|uniref:3-oxoacyl-[acyl-carrier-protein] synthase 2 n=1 Tax=candidate division WOR-3 bacterium TaxID=2052148 RepID=A0A9C9ENF7_UNCW3|nr:beta-ketoacyl-[acyl-carrier-protein] synthase II [candidate division WOR-3 bacterium]
MKRVVITGIGAITPLGDDVKTTWEALLQGKSGIDLIKAFDTSQHTVKIAGEVKDFQPEKKFDPKTIKRLDRCVQLSLWATAEAIDDAGIDLDKYDKTEIGVIIGSGIGGLTTWEREHTKFLQAGPKRVSPFLIPMMIPDMTSGYVAIHWGLKGPNYTTISACASGAHALGAAFRAIKYGDADVIISGGAEAPVTPFALAGFSNMRALSRRNDEPQKASRPFDKSRDGFVMAEGAATLILEELEFAQKRGAKIYGEIVGFGATGDGYHITAPSPGGEGARRSMERAIKEAGCRKEDISYINTHGTSTPLNDQFEIQAIKDLFGEHAGKLVLNATKSMIGHTLGAAGAIEAIVTLLSIRDNVVHPTINLEEPLEQGEGLHIVGNNTEKIEIEYALSNSLGFGGHNATLCFRRFSK